MKFIDDATAPLALMGGVIQAQRLVVPANVIMGLKSYRHACRLAWRLRRPRNLTQRTLAELAGLYAPHISEYFSVRESKRELPARHIGIVCEILGNTVIAQWQAQDAKITVLEEMQASRREVA